MKLLALALLLTTAAPIFAQEPTIATTCKRIERDKEGDTIWIMFSDKGQILFCAEMHDAFHRTKWFVALPERSDQPAFSTEPMAVAFIEKQPAPKAKVTGTK